MSGAGLLERYDNSYCVTCGQRITGAGFGVCCCEVCWDSMDAAEMRLAEQEHRRAIEGLSANMRRRAAQRGVAK